MKRLFDQDLRNVEGMLGDAPGTLDTRGPCGPLLTPPSPGPGLRVILSTIHQP